MRSIKGSLMVCECITVRYSDVLTFNRTFNGSVAFFFIFCAARRFDGVVNVHPCYL